MPRILLAFRAWFGILFRNELPEDVARCWGFTRVAAPQQPKPAATVKAPQQRWSKLDPGWLVLLTLPFLSASLNSAWLYSAVTTIDPWMYFGYFLDFVRFKSELFPSLYYGSRLPWIVPGYIANRLFDPVAAKYVLHFGFYYLAVFSLYSLLKRANGRKNALLGAILFGTHVGFLYAIGWDYVDGPGITYSLLGLAAAGRAACARRPWLWLALSGMAGAAMFYCNLFLLILLPFLPLFYLFLTFKGLTKQALRSASYCLLWFCAGGLLLTVLLGILNLSLDGHFWFYMPSVRTAVHYSTGPNPWRKPLTDWIRSAYWLGFPAMTIAASLVYLLWGARRRTFRWGDAGLFFALQFTMLFLLILGLDLRGMITFQLPYYTSFLLPLMFLVIGSVVAFPMEKWKPWQFWLLIPVTALLFSLPLRPSLNPYAYVLSKAGLLTLALCGAGCLVLKVFFRGRWAAMLLVLAAFWVYQVSVLIPYDFGVSLQDRKGSFLRVVDAVKAVRPYTKGGRVLFWYDALEQPAGWEFNAINSSYLNSWAWIGPHFPAIAAGVVLQPQMTGVILSGREHVLEQADEALRPRRLKARALGTREVSRNGVSYRLTFFELEQLDAKSVLPLKLAIGPMKGEFELVPAAEGAAPELPADKWVLASYPDSPGRLELGPDGVRVTTARRLHAYGSLYARLMAGRSGLYRFELQYRVISGALAFGALSADQSHHLVPLVSSAPAKRSQRRVLMLPLKAGEGLVLLISNNDFGASTYLIESLRAFGAFDQSPNHH